MKAARARVVLRDCRLAHEELELVDSQRQFRFKFAGAMSLIRAVGHVLQKVDGSSNAKLQKAISTAWRLWSLHPEKYPLFHDFICRERNLILKEYDFNLDERNSIPVLLQSHREREDSSIDDCLFKPILDGSFAGEDVRDVYMDAIMWWECEISKIEEIARQIS